MKTAAALALTVPPWLLASAHEGIEWGAVNFWLVRSR